MRRRISPLALLAGFLALAACAAQEQAPAPAAPAPAAPAPAAQPAWEQEWERVLAAAKREGRVAVFGGQGGPDWRRALTQPFERKYGITVEFMSGQGFAFVTRFRAEREARQYLWDIFIAGTSTLLDAKELGGLDPIEPALILPEVKDPKAWRGGQLPFFDKDRLVIDMQPTGSEAFIVNPKMVDPKEFKSWKDLLDPKWKGKIAAFTPTIGGGLSKFQSMYLNKHLGPDFIRALAKQELIILGDHTQMLQWVAEGKYPLCVGCSGTLAEPLIKAGAPLAFVDPKQLKEGGHVASGPVGGLGLVNRAPHPNAAKVYLNWLLSKEGQTESAPAAGKASARLDAPTDHLRPWEVPTGKEINMATEEAVKHKTTVVKPFVEEVFR